MGLSTIIERIGAQAEQEAGNVIADAEHRAEEITAKTRAEAGALVEDALAKARADGELEKSRRITLALLDLRKQLGHARQAAIDRAFSLALDWVQKMNDATYLGLLRELILEAVETGEEQVVLSPTDRVKVSDGFLAEVNARLAAMGRKGDLRFASETRQMLGGVILAGENVELNCTFDTALKLIRDDIEPRVAALLFGDAGSKRS